MKSTLAIFRFVNFVLKYSMQSLKRSLGEIYLDFAHSKFVRWTDSKQQQQAVIYYRTAQVP